MAAARRWVYYFGDGKAEGRSDQKELLGGKGAGLAEMTRIGLPVPQGFTITTEACFETTRRDGKWPAGLEKQVRQQLAKLERSCKKKFGDPKDPLMVSVRSGAAVSMPGMMETILNLGLNDQSVEGLAVTSGNRRFAFDAYRRLIMMYGSTAMGVDREIFDETFEEIKRQKTAPRLELDPFGVISDTDVNTEELETVVESFKEVYREGCGEPFPQDAFDQLKGSIGAVFNSWMSEKAVTYRRVERITGLPGTAVNICRMVFGNMGDDSSTGVCFTRDPSTGENRYYGDLLINAQGEDVVAGVRTPMQLDELKSIMPEAYDQLEAVRIILEVHYKEMQDLEFTVERGKLYMLQCRSGKRSPAATFKIAVDQATKGVTTPAAAKRLVDKKYLPKKYLASASKPVITKNEAIRRIKGVDIERLFYPILDPGVSNQELAHRSIGKGINAVPGAACGEIVLNAKDAETKAAEGKNVILVRRETSPEDVGGMSASVGILTTTGGKTSHAAVVARGWGKCCIVGCEALHIDYAAKSLSLGDRKLRPGEMITLDGDTGKIYFGAINLVPPVAPPEYDTLIAWCDKLRRLKVRANADTPADATKAVELGAEGIGLCRTEHMFFDPSQPQRIIAMREMILADNEDDRRKALDKLLPFQRGDFEGIFEAMDKLPVTVRLLDPPLHEFLPHEDNAQGIEDVLSEINTSIHEQLSQVADWDNNLRRSLEAKLVSHDDVKARVLQLHESNPMLGHRGCRLCVTYPEILDMQVTAIIEAAVNCTERGIKVLPEIMIPLSIDGKELGILVDRVHHTADAILKQRKSKLKYLVGTMIETPRAALTSDKMADVAEFFSFGTNDLTQMAMGLSRDDAGRFLGDYIDQRKVGIFKHDPFQSLDIEGVGLLVEMAVAQGRGARPKLKLGICGEHGGDPASIRFCHRVGLDYVSCSPFRVPIARLSAAQATIEEKSLAGVAAPKGKSKAKPIAKTKAKAKPKAKARPKVAVKSKSATRKTPKTKAKTKTSKTKVKKKSKVKTKRK